MWIETVGLSALSGFLYRLGGMGNSGRAKFPWVPGWVFNTKARDVGCTVCCLIWMLLYVKGTLWAYILGSLALFGALTTYWDTIFGYDNYWLHGWACGIAYLPFAIAGDTSAESYLIRCFALCVTMGVWSHVLWTNDNIEEFGRGAFLVLSLPLVLYF